ncbi:Glucose-dependent insulinotropic receptor [Varanus komodoensis]|uniref:G protein-coupled receptor 119 n=1 Tax=Varanus komodoensis TaxID=61221 RepID=A0A8D2L5Q9_VARKO|nr:glucose-dependent insulinotropic receptor [Varanus komodoensis]KAF7244949.1 Glucose-dependent insulinotropic receptor [Varanus komodoensis]
MGDVAFGILLATLASLIMALNALMVIVLARLIWRSSYLGLCFVLNLAIADALVGFTITGLATEELSDAEHHIPQRYCALRMAFITCPCAASILTVMLVAFDRYLAIKHPFRYFQIMRSPVVGAFIGGLWLLACLIGFLPVIARSFQQENYQGSCTFFAVFQPTYLLTVLCVSFFPAFFVFVYFHCHLLKIASLQMQQIRELQQIGLASTYPVSPPSSDMKALRTVAISVGCFALSWSPFFIGSIVQVVCQRCILQHVLERYLWVLGVFNSLVNPLVYAYWQKEVRLQLYRMCRCMKSRVFPLFWTDSQARRPGRVVASVHVISLAQFEE